MSTVIISAATAKEKYPVRPGLKTPNGSPIRDCGDAVAVALRGTGMEDWLDIADRNDIRSNIDALIAAGKNVGQVRMSLGRMLRARLANHEADPEKNAAPYLPEPKPVPVKAEKADPKPEPEPVDPVEDESGDEDGDEE